MNKTNKRQQELGNVNEELTLYEAIAHDDDLKKKMIFEIELIIEKFTGN